MTVDYTGRGFSIYNFSDRNGNRCSLQKSSLAFEDCIWLGCDDIGLKRFEPLIGWSDVVLYETEGPGGIKYLANTRMQLTQEQVRLLLPMLQKFVETGDL